MCKLTLRQPARSTIKTRHKSLFGGRCKRGKPIFMANLNSELRTYESSRYVPLPKSSRSERIRSNTQVFDFELDNDDMDALDALDQGGKGAVTWNPVEEP
jgi:hypothetical protein